MKKDKWRKWLAVFLLSLCEQILGRNDEKRQREKMVGGFFKINARCQDWS